MTIRYLGRQSWRATRATARVCGPAIAWGVRQALGNGEGIPAEHAVPAGRDVDLPGRGTTYVVDIPGPRPDAPVLLLLHGIFTTGCLTWFSVLDDLARDYRVITFDQRWHGRGIASDGFRLDDCADDAAAVLDACGVDRAVAVGYSMGGATAQVLAHRHPDRLAGLVLCSTSARWGNHLAERAFYQFLGAMNARMLPGSVARVRAHRDGLGPARDLPADRVREWALAELRATSPWSMPQVLGELGRFDGRAWLAEVTVPTGVVITGRDWAIPTAKQRAMARHLPDAIVRESPGGHASLVFDKERWRPLFLEVVGAVAGGLVATG